MTATYEILKNEPIAQDVFRMRLAGEVKGLNRPGIFVNIQLDGFYLRRPISLHNVGEGWFEIIYKILGDGTREMSTYPAGKILDILLPLGNGFSIKKNFSSPLLVGGGVGAPPLYLLCKMLLEKGQNPTVILGFNTAADVILKQEFEALGVKTLVATADGSVGTKGFVTHVLPQAEFDYYYACGPMPMLKALKGAVSCEGQLSFEERMGCGFGACMGCSCKTLTGYKRICADGPVLLSSEVTF